MMFITGYSITREHCTFSFVVVLNFSLSKQMYTHKIKLMIAFVEACNKILEFRQLLYPQENTHLCLLTFCRMIH